MKIPTSEAEFLKLIQNYFKEEVPKEEQKIYTEELWKFVSKNFQEKVQASHAKNDVSLNKSSSSEEDSTNSVTFFFQK